MLSKQKGQALVETAVSLPIIVFLLFAMMLLGFYIYDKTVVLVSSDKALDTWIGLSDDMDAGEKEARAEEAGNKYLGLGVFLTDVDVQLSEDPDAKSVTVNVRGDFSLPLPFLQQIFGSKTQIESESTFEYDG